MTKSDMRRVGDYLWDGEPQVVRVMGQLRQFKRHNEIFFWLVANHVRGKELLAFFNNAANDETKGVLQGVRLILNSIDSTPFDRSDLKIKDLT